MTALHSDKWVGDASPEDQVADVAARTLRARLAAVLHYLPLAALEAERDVEHVHQLRVWTRRAEAALALYSEMLPARRTAWFRKQLKRIRLAANEARELDVLSRRLEADGPSAERTRWLDRVRRQRAEAQGPIRAIHERLTCGGRFRRRIAALLRRLRARGEGGRARRLPPFGAWATGRLRPIVDAFFAAAPCSGAAAAALHHFRIRGKKLRYAMELLAGAFPPEMRERLYPAVEDMQERLGAINDLATAQSHLRRQIEDSSDSCAARRLRELLAEEQARLDQARRDFLAWCDPALLRALLARFESLLKGPTAARNGRTGRLCAQGRKG